MATIKIGSVDHQHLPLPERKHLTGRLLLVRAYDARPSETESEEKIARNSLRDGYAAAANSGHRGNNDLSLSDYLDQILNRVEHTADQSAIELIRLQNEIQIIRCIECVPADGIGCNGNIFSDDKKAREGGLCMVHLNDLFELMVNLTESIYSTYVENSDEQNLQVVFLTRKSDDHVKDIQGKTDFPDRDTFEIRCSHVYLVVPIAEFSPEHYFSIPYILFHELAVHAMQCFGKKGGREVFGERSAFSEGFVDSAAFELFENELPNSVATLSDTTRVMADRFLDHSRSRHESRYGYIRTHGEDVSANISREDSAKRDRDRGRKVYRGLKQLSERANMDKKRWPARIALTFNQFDLDPIQRNGVLAALNVAGNSSPGSPRQLLYLRWLKRSCESGLLAAPPDEIPLE